MENRAKGYVLDTSAILTYLLDENGSDLVEEVLLDIKKHKSQGYVSFVTLSEIYYISLQRGTAATARERLVHIKALPFEVVHSDERIALSAGWFKAFHSISLGDSFIAATAMEKEATLIHKDPEFETLAKFIDLLPLPYKKQQ